MSITPSASEYLLSRDKIKYTRLSEFTVIEKFDGSLVIEVDRANVQEFRELIRRGSNTWDAGSPAVQEFSDLIRVGHIQQTYKK